MNKVKKLPREQEVALAGSIIWSKGTVEQGKRLLLAIKNLCEHNPDFPLNTDEDNEKSVKLNDICSYEMHFFAHALHYLTFHLERASNTFSGFKNFLNKIDATTSIKDINDIRNMLTHIDEYAKGGGWEKDSFIHKFTYVESSTTKQIECDATTSVILHKENNLVIGGRIDVQKTIQIVAELLPKITETCKKIWENVNGPIPKSK